MVNVEIDKKNNDFKKLLAFEKSDFWNLSGDYSFKCSGDYCHSTRGTDTFTVYRNIWRTPGCTQSSWYR